MYIHFVDVCIPRHRDKYGIETRYVIGCYKGYGKISYQKNKKRKERKEKSCTTQHLKKHLNFNLFKKWIPEFALLHWSNLALPEALLHFWLLFVCSWPVFFLQKALRIFSVPHILKSRPRLSCCESVLIYSTGYWTALNTHPSTQGNSPAIFLHIISFSPFPLYFLCSLVSDWASKFSRLFLSCPFALVSLDDFLISKSSY